MGNDGSGGVLAVPIDVDAFVVTEKMNEKLQRWVPNFHLTHLHRSPEPGPFSNGGANDLAATPKPGVYVRWQLPRVLCSGTMTDGMVTFPLVPTRWLVLRRCVGVATAAWVIDSDYVHLKKVSDKTYNPHSDVNAEGVPYLHPYASTVTDPNSAFRTSLSVTRIGRRRPLHKWVEAGAEQPFLTAVGPGLTAFQVFQPYHQDVFSLHDTLDQFPEDGKLSYVVAGWFPTKGKDTLAELAGKAAELAKFSHYDQSTARGRWAALREEFAALTSWDVPPGAGAIPSRSVYHGQVVDVDWSRAGTQPQSLRPAVNAVTLAIGTSVTDGVTAMAQEFIKMYTKGDPAKARAASDAFEAAQNSLTSLGTQQDGEVLTRGQLHHLGFGRGAGGGVWRIRPRESGATTAPPWDGVSGHETELAALNHLQQSFDQHTRLLAALRWRLFLVWATHALPRLSTEITREDLLRQLDRHTDTTVAAQAAAQQAIVDDLQHSLDTAHDTLVKTLAKDNVFELTTEDLPAFHRAQDPMLVLRGLYSGEQPPPLVPDTLLPCTVVPTTPDTEGPQDVAKDDWARLPDEVRPALATLVRDSTGRPWRQPWQPLFLQWKGEYHYIPFHNNQLTSPTWRFDGNRFVCHGQDKQWITDHETQRAASVGFEGRGTLAGLPAYNLQAQVKSQIDLLPAGTLRDTLQAIYVHMVTEDLVSQSLDGFTEQLACLDPTPNLSAPPGLADLIRDAGIYLPDVGPSRAAFTEWAVSEFAHLRAGWFTLTQLQVVDTFGQTLDLIRDDDTVAVKHFLAPGVTPDIRLGDNNRRAQASPRLLQPGRLRFDIISATEGQPVDLEANANPVCGWVVPNYLDKSLLCYDPDGQILGELRLALTTTTPRKPVLTWATLPAIIPTHTVSESPLSTIGDTHLGRFAHHLITTSEKDQGAAFLALLHLIDTSLTRIEPGEGANDTNLTTMVTGRPLALLRTRLRLELDGPPRYDPAWRRLPAICGSDFFPTAPAQADSLTGHDWNEIAEVLTYDWPVRLGQRNQFGDGLIGYFLDTPGQTQNYELLHTVYEPPTKTPYLTWIEPAAGQEDGYLRLPLVPAVPGTYQPAGRVTEVDLTLVCDPQAPVHATTDILPVSTIALPAKFVQPPMAAMRVGFRFSPVMTTTRVQDTDPPKTTTTTDVVGAAQAQPAVEPVLVMPVPTVSRGSWSWAEHTDPESHEPTETWREHHVTPSDDTPRFDELLPVTYADGASTPDHATEDALPEHFGPVLRSGALMLTGALGDGTQNEGTA